MTPSDYPLLRVLFVCRGSSLDGLGHVMRCRTLALSMGRRMPVRMVVIGDRYVDSLLKNRGLNYEVVGGEEDATPIVDAYRPDIVIFDLMQFDRQRFDRIARASLTVSVSPIFNLLADVDMLFHRTTRHGEDWDFSSRPSESRPELRCGLPYTLVRPQCEKIVDEEYRRTLAQDPLSVVVSMGGTDAKNKTLQVLESMQAIPKRLLIWVLLGEGYAHSYQQLVDTVNRGTRHEIILAKTSDSMWRIMKSCALAVLAGGVITYECAYAGLPSINVFHNKNSVFLVEELIEKGVALSAGYPLQDALSVVNANIAHLEQNRDELAAMHGRATGLIDGQAATRIEDEIVQYYRTDYQPKCAKSDEADRQAAY